MNGFLPSLWTETLKLRRSKVPLFAAMGLSVAPFVGGLFMIILKDPEAARSMGLISTKAQIAAGVADWPAFFGMLAQAIAIGGAMVFAIVTAWVFGREFSDRTARSYWHCLPTGSNCHCEIHPDRRVDDCHQSVHFWTRSGRGQAGCHPGWSQELLRALLWISWALPF
jgi:hypothetical protein